MIRVSNLSSKKLQLIACFMFNVSIYGVPYALDDRVLYCNVDIVNTLADTTDEDWLGTELLHKKMIQQ